MKIWEHWSDLLIKFGVYMSAGWTFVSVAALWAFADWSEKLSPNKWADLAAGFADPLAFNGRCNEVG